MFADEKLEYVFTDEEENKERIYSRSRRFSERFYLWKEHYVFACKTINVELQIRALILIKIVTKRNFFTVKKITKRSLTNDDDLFSEIFMYSPPPLCRNFQTRKYE